MKNNKLLLALVGVVFVIVIALIVNVVGDDEEVAQSPVSAPVDATEDDNNSVADIDADTVENTIETMSARNKYLEDQIKVLTASQDNVVKQQLKESDIDSMVARGVRDNTNSIVRSFQEKLDRVTSQVNAKLKSKTGDGIKLPNGLGFDGLDKSSIRNSSFSTSGIGQEEYITIEPMSSVGFTDEKSPRVIGIDGNPIGEPEKDARMRNKKKKAAESIPFYTIPQNSTLFVNSTLTDLVGVVPSKGAIIDPIRFKLITGNTNIATNGLYVPGVKNIVWSGIAVGNREMSCVRGELHSVTFTFEDGTVRTVQSQKAQGKNKYGGKMLGYIATEKGNPCMPGRLISNASDYLRDRLIASGVGATAEAFAETQETTIETTNGITSVIDGDANDYILGKTISGSLTELNSYLRERQREAVDIVYLAGGQNVVLHVESQIEIDYEPDGRKLDHASNISSISNNRLD